VLVWLVLKQKKNLKYSIVDLVFLHQEMAGVDVFFVSDESHFETIACVVLDAEFVGKVPDQWYLRVFANDTPAKTLLFAVKRRRK